MKNTGSYLIVLTSFFFCCFCNHKTYSQPVTTPKHIFKNFSSFWDYHNRFVELNRDFVALDSNKNTIPKKEFFERMINGGFLALRLRPEVSNNYQLYKEPGNVDPEISRIIREMASEDCSNFMQQGKAFPRYDFVDLTNTHYNNENTKGKIIVIKCWFVGCAACVQAFPENNSLFEKYKNDPNIIFLSLAFDDKAKLTKFLSDHPLHCGTVANQKKFLTDELKIRAYPTNIIIKDGIIIRQTNTVNDIDRELGKWAR